MKPLRVCPCRNQHDHRVSLLALGICFFDPLPDDSAVWWIHPSAFAPRMIQTVRFLRVVGIALMIYITRSRIQSESELLI